MKFLPDSNWSQPESAVGGSGHLAASEINELANDPRELTATVAARGALIPVLYGRRDVPGLVFVWGKSGTDLVIGYIWCVGEVDAIEDLYLNDEAVPAGVTVTHYLGTPTQGVDPTLASAVAAYNDTLRITLPGGDKLGICYSAVQIPPGSISGFPRARAVIRGRKVLDPRTSTIGYSASPALMLNDLITNPAFGLARTVAGAETCADWCDTELGGISGAYRARSAIYIAQGRRAEEYLDLLCEYAECLRVYEGSTIKLVPDAPVDLDAAPIVGPSSVIADSFRLSAESSSDTPTEVELQYTQPATVPEESWPLVPVVVRLAGVTEGEVQRVPTSITLDGIYRPIEATNKAQARLNRMQGRITSTWNTLDAGVTHQRGDVVKVQLPARGIDLAVRIEDVNLVGAGRYQVTASRYDISHYPSDAVLPGGDGFVPEGAIGILIGTEVPTGWTLFSSANGKYIVGAGGAFAPGDTGGSNTAAALPTTTTANGAHEDAPDMYGAATGPNPMFYTYPQSIGVDASDHTHTLTIPSMDSDLLRRQTALVIKTGGADIELPASVLVFGLPNTNTTATKNIAYSGRLLMANTAGANLGTGSMGFTVSGSSAEGDHDHFPYLAPQDYDPSVFGPVPKARRYTVAGAHSHTATGTATFNIKRTELCSFGAATPYAIRAGMIFMWSGSVGALPTDYVLCDGTNGTPDMRDRLAAFAGNTPATPAGDNTVNYTLTTSNEGHSHDLGILRDYSGPGSTEVPAKTVDAYGHAATVYHSHTANDSQAFVPAYYALAFIMYAPAG